MVNFQYGAYFSTDNRAASLASAEAAFIKGAVDGPLAPQAHMYLGLVQIFTDRAAEGISECERG